MVRTVRPNGVAMIGVRCLTADISTDSTVFKTELPPQVWWRYIGWRRCVQTLQDYRYWWYCAASVTELNGSQCWECKESVWHAVARDARMRYQRSRSAVDFTRWTRQSTNWNSGNARSFAVTRAICIDAQMSENGSISVRIKAAACDSLQNDR